MRTVGVEEELLLVDVHTGKPRSVASQVITATDGDSVQGAGVGGVEAGIDRLTQVGTGATGQRRTFAKTGQLVDVVVEAVRRTAGR
jgi:hypothetical protein